VFDSYKNLYSDYYCIFIQDSFQVSWIACAWSKQAENTLRKLNLCLLLYFCLDIGRVRSGWKVGVRFRNTNQLASLILFGLYLMNLIFAPGQLGSSSILSSIIPRPEVLRSERTVYPVDPSDYLWLVPDELDLCSRTAGIILNTLINHPQARGIKVRKDDIPCWSLRFSLVGTWWTWSLLPDSWGHPQYSHQSPPALRD